MARDIMAAAGDWRPDVIVRENTEFGGYLAAEALGLPHASVGAAGGGVDYLDVRVLAPALDVQRTALGLPGDPDGVRVYAYLHANLAPARYDGPELPVPRSRYYRQTNPELPDERLPEWLAEMPDDRPFVLAAFGTMYHGLAVWDAIVGDVVVALGGVDCTAVVPLGAAVGHWDRAIPDNVRLVDHVPQPLLLECADLFVNHGGFNGVREALRLAVPMVIIPWLTEQPDNAARCARAGVARVLSHHEVTPARVRQACTEVLGDPSYRRNARRMRREMLASPPIDAFVADLESLVAAHDAGQFADRRATVAPAAQDGPDRGGPMSV
jgi:N-glycosyltransferase